MSKYRHRLTQCLFGSKSSPTFASLGETYQRLKGTLANACDVLAVPDSGAERNVMSLQYAVDNGFHVETGPNRRNWLQFADGSCEETFGQVETYWTFATGERVPLTFEVLENCYSDVIIGEEILTQHNVFEIHASSLVFLEASPDSHELAPFGFIYAWQRALGRVRGSKSKDGQDQTRDIHATEQRRRDRWNYENEYVAEASAAEREREDERRRLYASRNVVDNHMPVIPSISTAHRGSSRRRPV